MPVTYADAKEKTDRYLASFAIGRIERFSFDTNILHILALNEDASSLEKLAACKGFHISYVVYYELLGKSRELSKKGRNIQEKFLFRVEKFKDLEEVDRFFHDLEPLEPLIPGKLVSDVMMKEKNSMLDKLVERYRVLSAKLAQNKLKPKETENATDDFKEDSLKVDQKIEDRAKELIVSKHIDEGIFGFDNYIHWCEVKKKRYLKELYSVMELRKDPNIIILVLEEMKRKKYGKDLRLVAEALASGSNLASMDQDVQALLRLYQARKT